MSLDEADIVAQCQTRIGLFPVPLLLLASHTASAFEEWIIVSEIIRTRKCKTAKKSTMLIVVMFMSLILPNFVGLFSSAYLHNADNVKLKTL